jgi:hypothetical protein
VGPIGGLDDMEKRKFLTLPGFEPRSLECPTRSQSLYQSLYAGSLTTNKPVSKEDVRGPHRCIVSSSPEINTVELPNSGTTKCSVRTSQ